MSDKMWQMPMEYPATLYINDHTRQVQLVWVEGSAYRYSPIYPSFSFDEDYVKDFIDAYGLWFSGYVEVSASAVFKEVEQHICDREPRLVADGDGRGGIYFEITPFRKEVEYGQEAAPVAPGGIGRAPDKSTIQATRRWDP